jgi:hypothetical protein
MAVEWIYPVYDSKGGTIYIYKDSEGNDVTEVIPEQDILKCGYECMNSVVYTGSFRYYRSYFTSFIYFNIPSILSSNITSVKVYFRIKGFNSEGSSDNTIDIFTKPDETVTTFPTVTLDEDDRTTPSWFKIDDLGEIEYLSSLYANGVWLGLDITSEFKDSIDFGLTMFPIKIAPSITQPPEYSFSRVVLTDYEEKSSVLIYGAGSLVKGDEVPEDYTESTIYYRPIIRIEYSTGTPTTASNVLCVDSDSKSDVFLAGTESGNVWRIYYTTAGVLVKELVATFDGQVSAIYMDRVKNLLDYPSTALTWIGLSNGDVYRGTISRLPAMSPVLSLDAYITFIRGSDVNSNKVIITTSSRIYFTTDGIHFSYKAIDGSITGAWVWKDIIQVVTTTKVYRSVDFGVVWLECLGVPADSKGIAFGVNNVKESIIGNGSSLYYNLRDSGEKFMYREGIDLSSSIYVLEPDQYSQLCYIGTADGIYYTSDWGRSAHQIKSGISIKDLAIGKKA